MAIVWRTGTTGQTLYAVVWNASGQAWNGAAFATYTTTRTTWDIPFTESPASTGLYQLSSIPGGDGIRTVEFFLQAGGSPADNDTSLGRGEGYVSSGALLDQSNIVAGTLLSDPPVSQRPVSDQFTVAIPKRSSGSANTLKIKTAEEVTIAVDFTAILALGDRLSTIVSIVDSNAESITYTALGVDRELAKMTVEGGEEDVTYAVTITVTTVFGNTLEGEFNINYLA